MEKFPDYYKNEHYFIKYLSFIENCNNKRKLTQKVQEETHHIVPKSFGGSNLKDNLISLSYREHFIAHLLLAKAFPHTNISICIFYFIYGSKRNKIIKTSRQFEFAKNLAGIKNSTWFNDGKCNFRIPKEVGEKLNYIIGRISTEVWKGMTYVNDGKNNRQIKKANLEYFLSAGYKKGMLRSIQPIPVTNGVENTSIPKDLLEDFLTQNPFWFLGYTVKSELRKKGNSIRMNKGNLEKSVLKTEVESYLKSGWNIGRSKKSKESCAKASFQIYLGDKNKRVSKEELPIFLNLGWKKGVPERMKKLNSLKTKGKIVIHTFDKTKEKRIFPNELQEYLKLGWIKGRKF